MPPILFTAPIEEPKLIEILRTKPTPIVEKVELTVDQKIQSNYFECDTEIQWIRKDNAECKEKSVEALTTVSSTNPVQSTTPTQKAVRSAVTSSDKVTAPYGWFKSGQCTEHVWSRRPVGKWNDARLWYSQAQRDGWATGLTARAGAIGVAKSGNHVVLVHNVDRDKIYLSERNYDLKGSYRERWASASDFKYIY